MTRAGKRGGNVPGGGAREPDGPDFALVERLHGGVPVVHLADQLQVTTLCPVQVHLHLVPLPTCLLRLHPAREGRGVRTPGQTMCGGEGGFGTGGSIKDLLQELDFVLVGDEGGLVDPIPTDQQLVIESQGQLGQTDLLVQREVQRLRERGRGREREGEGERETWGQCTTWTSSPKTHTHTHTHTHTSGFSSLGLNFH